MVFGGVMDAIGALARITDALLKMATSIFGLFASTVVSCLALNLTASDQYLALVIPGKMFKKAYEDKGLAPENLSQNVRGLWDRNFGFNSMEHLWCLPFKSIVRLRGCNRLHSLCIFLVF